LLHRWLWAGGLAAFLLGGAAAWLLLREWLAGFGALATVARRLGADASARERLPVAEGGGELAALARDVNAMLDRLESSLAAQQRFTGDASHELRTPLAILRSELEIALRRDRTTAEYRDALANCREESERLSRLVENLIALARADAGEGLGELEPVNLAALAAEFCERLRSVAAADGVQLICHSDGPCEVRGDRLALERIFVNLIENAIRHTPRGESVEIRTRGEDSGVLVEVADRGPGVPPEHLPRIFDRFYRVDKARSRERGGAGLGLSIVKSLVEAHRGRIEVHGEFGHGATFRVWLPRG
jgi:heavy metal sensor kinase